MRSDLIELVEKRLETLGEPARPRSRLQWLQSRLALVIAHQPNNQSVNGSTHDGIIGCRTFSAGFYASALCWYTWRRKAQTEVTSNLLRPLGTIGLVATAVTPGGWSIAHGQFEEAVQ